MTRSLRNHTLAALGLLLMLLAAIGPAAAQTATPFPTIPVLPTVSGGGSPAVTQTATPLPADLTASTFEMVGEIQAVTLTSLTVNGQVIDILSAEVTSALGIGTAVTVEGTVTSAGQLVARQVRALDLTQPGLQADELELIGLLTAQTGSRLTIAGLPMDATFAEIKPGVAIGAWVKVHASFDSAGNWIIREIELAGADDFSGRDSSRAGEFEITGTLATLGEGFIVVNGQRIDTTAAEIHGPLVVGALVKVHLSAVDGVWVAREVELTTRTSGSSDDSRSGEIEITGTLTAINGSTIVVDGRTIDISRAEVNDPLSVGMIVKVHLSVVNGVSVAREIERADSGDDSGNDSSGSGSSGSGGSDDSGDDSGDDHGGDRSDSDDSGSDDHGGDDTGHGGSGSGDSGDHGGGDD